MLRSLQSTILHPASSHGSSSPSVCCLPTTIFHFFCGSFSAVSKPNFASKYSFCSIFQDLHNEHAFAPPTTQNLQTFAQFCKFLMTFPDFLKILLKFDEIVLFFGENFTEFRRNSRESQLIYGNSDFFQKIRKIVLEF